MSFCYPEGNFGRNQLLDGSISLSPLYPNLTIDLHIRITTSLHQSIVHHLSGPNRHALTQIYQRISRSVDGAPINKEGSHPRSLSFRAWSVFQDGSFKAITSASLANCIHATTLLVSKCSEYYLNVIRTADCQRIGKRNGRDPAPIAYGILTLHDVSFQRTYTKAVRQ
ncbi:hypothetical protein G9A89_013042 [Geosiphon pyriformis]|nr:hypothetical protein G9A89_013042 [Geosiphon pyriformis]